MKNLEKAIYNHDVLEVAKEILYPRRQFVGDSIPYEFKNEIDVKNFLIPVNVWMNTMLELDEQTDIFNKIILKIQQEEFHFDYSLIEELQNEHGFDDIEIINQGYTYNDSDYCRLDRDIHYTAFKYDGDYYIIFNIHCGADARAGFSEAVCFKVKDIDYLFGGMNIQVWDSKDNDFDWWDVENIATYNKDSKEWIHNETGEVLSVYSSAEGF